MNNQTYQIKNCRLCDNTDIKDIYSFGDLFVSNFTIDTDPSKYIKAPLVLTKCDNCDLIQLKHTAPQELLYSGFYWYRSSVTGTMISHLDNLVQDIHSEILLNDNDIVLDITNS